MQEQGNASVTMEPETKQGLYIYCITSAAGSENFGPLGIGGRGDELFSVAADELAAVVSHCPMQKFRLSRDNLLAHERAIEEVMKTRTVLPVRFATVAENEQKVRKILLKEAEHFTSFLHDMQGRREMGLKASFKSDPIYVQIAALPAISRMRQRVSCLPPDKIYFQKMELGRMVETALQELREQRRADIMDVLSPLSLDVRTTKPYGEMMIVNAAFLVADQREEEFDQAVRALDERFGQVITWRYTGTVPPFNFVSLTINAEEL